MNTISKMLHRTSYNNVKPTFKTCNLYYNNTLDTQYNRNTKWALNVKVVKIMSQLYLSS